MHFFLHFSWFTPEFWEFDVVILQRKSEMYALSLIENCSMSENTVKEKLREILAEVNYGQICLQYFHKSPSWLYNKINRNMVDGKPAELTPDEILILKGALCDLSNRIRKVADTL